jgi:hypothetical protein
VEEVVTSMLAELGPLLMRYLPLPGFIGPWIVERFGEPTSDVALGRYRAAVEQIVSQMKEEAT